MKARGWINPAYFNRCERCFRQLDAIHNLLAKLANGKDKKLAGQARKAIRQILEMEL